MPGKHEQESHSRSLLQTLIPKADLSQQMTAPPAVTEQAERLPLRQSLYLSCYGMGAFTKRCSRWLWHRFVRCLAPVGEWFARLWKRAVTRPLAYLREENLRIREDVSLVRGQVKEAGRRHPLLAVPAVLQAPWTVIRRHRHFLSAMAQTAMIAAAVIVLVAVIRYWENTTFALELVYGGKAIGYIHDEAVLQTALDMAEGRVIKEASDTYVIERESYLTLRPVQQSAVMDETELCDRILKMSGSAVSQMSGLYIDGHFEGALATHAAMQTLLNDILAEYDTQANTSSKTAEFMSTVQVVDGLYPVNALEQRDVLWQRLTAKDEKGLPYLMVQIRCTEIHDEPIPFEYTTLRDRTKYIGYSEVRIPGEDGINHITADVIYLNGVEQYREILSEEVVKKPVTQVTVVGSYRVNGDAKPGVPTGEFIWPLPSCHMICSEFGYRWGKLHAGIDISGNGVYGKDIIAADGGVVKQINRTDDWGGGYGYYVIVDHGSGYVSVYCHCSEILVEAGQKVTQGELIAKVGSTGDSYGAHLHFEIRINGTSVDPVPYL